MLKNKEWKKKLRKNWKYDICTSWYFFFIYFIKCGVCSVYMCMCTQDFIIALKEHPMILKHILPAKFQQTFYAIKVNSTPKRKTVDMYFNVWGHGQNRKVIILLNLILRRVNTSFSILMFTHIEIWIHPENKLKTDY